MESCPSEEYISRAKFGGNTCEIGKQNVKRYNTNRKVMPHSHYVTISMKKDLRPWMCLHLSWTSGCVMNGTVHMVAFVFMMSKQLFPQTACSERYGHCFSKQMFV